MIRCSNVYGTLNFAGSNGCQQMAIDVSNTDSFDTICASTSSCSDMVVNLRFDDPTEHQTDYGAIYCVVEAACNNDERTLRLPGQPLLRMMFFSAAFG